MRRSQSSYSSTEEFLKVLKEFKMGVDKGWYEKISYQTWKEMLRACEKAGSIRVVFTYSVDKYAMADLDDCDIDITFTSYEPYAHDYHWSFTSDDLSFGMYLTEEYSSIIIEMDKDESFNSKLQGTSSLPVYDYLPKLYDIDTCYGANISGSDYSVSNKIDALEENFLSLKLDTEKATDSIKELAEQLKKSNIGLIQPEEEKVMMKGFNFEFGPLNGGLAKMSIYGLAVRNKAGVYVSYNAETQELMDVEIFQFDGSKFLYRMPVAVKDIIVGDVVIHQNIPMFVVEIPVDGKTLKVVDPCNGERKEIMLTRSPFGFNFATKIVNFLDGVIKGVTPSADNPFGNMWMLALMDENKDMTKMLPFMFMNQNGMNIDPMMMMFMMGDNKDMGDMLPLMMMMNMNKPAAAPVHECHCGGHCHDEKHSSDC